MAETTTLTEEQKAKIIDDVYKKINIQKERYGKLFEQHRKLQHGVKQEALKDSAQKRKDDIEKRVRDALGDPSLTSSQIMEHLPDLQKAQYQKLLDLGEKPDPKTLRETLLQIVDLDLGVQDGKIPNPNQFMLNKLIEIRKNLDKSLSPEEKTLRTKLITDQIEDVCKAEGIKIEDIEETATTEEVEEVKKAAEEIPVKETNTEKSNATTVAEELKTETIDKTASSGTGEIPSKEEDELRKKIESLHLTEEQKARITESVNNRIKLQKVRYNKLIEQHEKLGRPGTQVVILKNSAQQRKNLIEQNVKEALGDSSLTSSQIMEHLPDLQKAQYQKLLDLGDIRTASQKKLREVLPQIIELDLGAQDGQIPNQNQYLLNKLIESRENLDASLSPEERTFQLALITEHIKELGRAEGIDVEEFVSEALTKEPKEEKESGTGSEGDATSTKTEDESEKEREELFKNPPTPFPGDFPAGNLSFSQEGVDYLFLPYITNKNEQSYFRVMRTETGDVFINIDEKLEDGSLSPKTYQILNTAKSNDGSLIVELANGTNVQAVTLPISATIEGNNALFETVAGLIRKKTIPVTALTESFPEVKNFSTDDEKILENTDIPTMKKIQASRHSADKVGQALVDTQYRDSEFRTLSGTSFGISLSNIEGFTEQTQRVSTLVSGDSNLLFNVTRQNGEKTETIAEFVQAEDGKVKMLISKECAEAFKAANPLVNMTLDSTDDAFYTCEIDQINIDNNGSIRVKARNVENAYIFSAPGIQIMDSERHAGAMPTERCFDVGITEKGLETALNGNKRREAKAKDDTLPDPVITLGRADDKGHTQFYQDSIEYSMAQAVYRERTKKLSEARAKFKAMRSDALAETEIRHATIKVYDVISNPIAEDSTKPKRSILETLTSIDSIRAKYPSLTAADVFRIYSDEERCGEIRDKLDGAPRIRDALDILSGRIKYDELEEELKSLQKKKDEHPRSFSKNEEDRLRELRTLTNADNKFLQQCFATRKEYDETIAKLPVQSASDRIRVFPSTLIGASGIDEAKLYIESQKENIDVNLIGKYKEFVELGDTEGAREPSIMIGLSSFMDTPKTKEELYKDRLESHIPENEPAKSYVEAEVQRLDARHKLTRQTIKLLEGADVSLDRENYTFEDVQKILAENELILREKYAGKPELKEIDFLLKPQQYKDFVDEAIRQLDDETVSDVHKDYLREVINSETADALSSLSEAETKQKNIEREQSKQPIFAAGDVSIYAVAVKTLVDKTGEDGKPVLDEAGKPVTEEAEQTLFIRRQGKDAYVYAHVVDDKGKLRDPQWLRVQYSYVTYYAQEEESKGESYGLRFDFEGVKNTTGTSIRLSSLEGNVDALEILSGRESGILKDTFGRPIKNPSDKEQHFDGYRGITETAEETSATKDNENHHLVKLPDGRSVEVINDTQGKNSARLPDENIALTRYEQDHSLESRLIEQPDRHIAPIPEPKPVPPPEHNIEEPQPTTQQEKPKKPKTKIKTKAHLEDGKFEGKKPKQSTTLALTGLAVFFLMLSVFIPFAQILAIGFGLLEIGHQCEPWNWIGWLNQDKVTATAKKVKVKEKEKNNTKGLINEKQTERRAMKLSENELNDRIKKATDPQVKAALQRALDRKKNPDPDLTKFDDSEDKNKDKTKKHGGIVADTIKKGASKVIHGLDQVGRKFGEQANAEKEEKEREKERNKEKKLEHKMNERLEKTAMKMSVDELKSRLATATDYPEIAAMEKALAKKQNETTKNKNEGEVAEPEENKDNNGFEQFELDADTSNPEVKNEEDDEKFLEDVSKLDSFDALTPEQQERLRRLNEKGKGKGLFSKLFGEKSDYENNEDLERETPLPRNKNDDSELLINGGKKPKEKSGEGMTK